MSGKKEGSVLTISFQIEGQEFTALNGGPYFQINPSISFFVNCDTSKEVDRLWSKLSDGGDVLMELAKYPFSEKYECVKDKFGVSWQIVPAVLGKLLSGADPAGSSRAMQALLKMKKLDFKTLQQAYEQQ